MREVKNLCQPPELTPEGVSEVMESIEELKREACRRNEIMDIVGDYDLDRLRELVDADRDVNRGIHESWLMQRFMKGE